ncbi:hypothetical protein [Paractinoplanes atraurantiacus]|uniref:hypothetical protein n=1 Tax=Paractinoplanes atraurantiacus TaxID=1036182 RepID=UPI000BE47D28|nr:hypothetical protein [Actinoplanes atraurantiacus]
MYTAFLLSRRTMVSPSYHMFMVFDPAYEEPAELEIAISAAIAGTVGWAEGVVAVSTAQDLARVTVDIEVLPATPPPADVFAENRLLVPTGALAVDKSADSEFHLGIALPPGPGTYGARLLGTGRAEARRGCDEAFAPGFTHESSVAAVAGLAGIEHYRLQVWHLSSEPDWTEEDDQPRLMPA